MIGARSSVISIAILMLAGASLPSTAGTRSQVHPLLSNPPAASETVIYAFKGRPDGEFPQARLMRDAGGSLYGTTLNGGAQGCGQCGTVFRLIPEHLGRFRETILYRFKGGLDGSYPAARLFENKVGDFFGSTERGGIANNGTVFEIQTSGSTYTTKTLYRFSGGSDGANPQAALISDASGALYGTTTAGGSNACSPSCGTVYKLTPSGSGYAESVLYRFRGGADGADPVGPLIVDDAGALYGTTMYGGGSQSCTYGCGTVFRLTPSRSGYVETVLYSFGGFNDGAQPADGLVADKHGALYGTTIGGGLSCPGGGGCGTVFELSRHGSGYTEIVIYRFNGNGDGANPTGNLVSDNAGTFYGTTSRSYGLSSCDCGTVFALTKAGSAYGESILHVFDGPTGDGSSPYAGLVLEKPTGTLYGTTLYGGDSNLGTAFKIKL